MYIKSYKELIVWQKSIDLVKEIYVLTSQFPKEEIYGLSIQMRRAAISIPSNITEGQRRKDLPEFLQFLRIADASSAELETQIIISKRLYSKFNYLRVDNLLEEIQKMLNAMIRNLDDKLKAQSSKLKAFTIVELIVAMSLFVILMSIAAGGLINVLRNQRAVVALMAVNDSVSLSLEQMAREIRTGYNFCLTPSGKFQFVNAYNEVIRYKLNNVSSTIERGPSGVFGMTSDVCIDDDSGFNYKPITADNVKISRFNISGCGKNIDNPNYTLYINGSASADECGTSGSNQYPPRLTISLSVTSQESDVAQLGIYTDIQTTISSRRIE